MCFQQDDSACRLRLEEKQGQHIRQLEDCSANPDRILWWFDGVAAVEAMGDG